MVIEIQYFYIQQRTEWEVPPKLLYAGDVRSFALLLLEMIAWLKMIRVPEDMNQVGQSRSWTLDRNLKRLTRGWTIAPSNSEAWMDNEEAHRNVSNSMDSCGSSMDDILSDTNNGPTMHCWENTVADIRDKSRCHSVEEFHPSTPRQPIMGRHWDIPQGGPNGTSTIPRRSSPVKKNDTKIRRDCEDNPQIGFVE